MNSWASQTTLNLPKKKSFIQKRRVGSSLIKPTDENMEFQLSNIRATPDPELTQAASKLVMSAQLSDMKRHPKLKRNSCSTSS